MKEALADHLVSADFNEAVNDGVAKLLTDAAERAEANDRKTVQPRDLYAENQQDHSAIQQTHSGRSDDIATQL